MRLFVVCLLQAVLLATTLSPGDDLASRPIRNVDYAMHFYTARQAAERLADTGRFWGYDAGWMAGFPQGMLGLVDNKLFGVLLFVAPDGYDAVIFNAAVLLALLCVPWVLYRAARVAGSSDAEASGTAIAGVALLFGAPLLVLFWVAGAISFVLASLLVVPAALVWSDALARGRFVSLRTAGAATLAAFALFVHPLAGIPLAAALVPSLLPRGDRAWFRRLAVAGGLGAFLALTLVPVVAGLGENAVHIRPLPRGGGNFPGGIQAFVLDWWTYLLDTPEYATMHYGFFGAGSLAAVVLLAAIGLVRHGSGRRVTRDAVIAGILACALLAYVASSISPSFRGLQPHRFVIPLGFFAAIPAGWAFAELLAALRERRWGAWVVAALVVVIVAEGAWTLRRRNLGSGVDAAEAPIAEFLSAEANDEGRVLIETDFAMVPAAPGASRRIGLFRFTLMPLDLSRELVGTDHMDSVIAHRYATFGDGRLFGRPIEGIDRETLRGLLDRYAVSTVIACSEQSRSVFDHRTDVVARVRDLADCRGYRVRQAVTSRFLEGSGKTRVALDRIEVRGARGDRLVLKYHWIPALATDPPLPIEEAPQSGARVGFIAVRPGDVADFDVVVAPSGAFRSLPEVIGRRLFGEG